MSYKQCGVLYCRSPESEPNNVWHVVPFSQPKNVAPLCTPNSLWCDDRLNPILGGVVRVHIPNNVAKPLSWQALKSLSPHCLIYGFHALMNCTLSLSKAPFL